MGILGFLFGFGCLVVIAWAIALLGDLVFGRKHRQQNRPQEQPLPKPAQFRNALARRSLPLYCQFRFKKRLQYSISYQF